MINVLIADDHPVVRQGIRQIVSTTTDIAVVDEVGEGRAVVSRTLECRPDLVLLDLSFPDMDGLDILKQLRHSCPGVAVVILTIHSEEQFPVRALKAGAAGYLLKGSAPDELVGAIRRVATGGRYLGEWLAETLAAHIGRDGERPPHDRLSDREYQVLRMIARGRSTGSIAADLALSVKTVATYRSRIFDKMHLHTNAELAAYVERHRLADGGRAAVGVSPTA